MPEPTSEHLSGGPRRPPLPARVRGLVVGVLVLAGLAVLLVRGAGDPSTDRPAARPTPHPSAAPTTGQALRVPHRRVTHVGHRLLGVHAGWEVLARGPGALVRIEPGTGTVVRTPMPPITSSGPASLVAVAHQVLVRPLDFVSGYRVRDEGRARMLTGALADGGVLLPGPDAEHVWFQRGSVESPVRLLDPTGRAVGTTVSPPAGAVSGFPRPDGAGGVLFGTQAGVYDANRSGRHLVTSGTVLAAGPTGWFVRRCAPGRPCVRELVDRRDWSHRLVPGPVEVPPLPGLGVLSPDGSTAAELRLDHARRTAVHLVDTRSGRDRAVDVRADHASLTADDLAWSPDGRWLFVVTARGRLVAVDPRTARSRGIGVSLPELSQLTVRPAQG